MPAAEFSRQAIDAARKKARNRGALTLAILFFAPLTYWWVWGVAKIWNLMIVAEFHAPHATKRMVFSAWCLALAWNAYKSVPKDKELDRVEVLSREIAGAIWLGVLVAIAYLFH